MNIDRLGHPPGLEDGKFLQGGFNRQDMELWGLIENRMVVDERTPDTAIRAIERDFEVVAQEAFHRTAKPRRFVQIAERTKTRKRRGRDRSDSELHEVRNHYLALPI